MRLRASRVRTVFRHFPVRSSHPRALPAACAAEAAAAQGAFWPMHDSLFADQGRLEDPHLWARAEALGLDVARFDADRRSDAVAARVQADFRTGVRGGVVTTPQRTPPRNAALTRACTASERRSASKRSTSSPSASARAHRCGSSSRP